MEILDYRINQTRRFLQVQEPSNINDDIRIPSSWAIPANVQVTRVQVVFYVYIG